MHPLVTIIAMVFVVLFERENAAAAVIGNHQFSSIKARWNLNSMTECVLGVSLCEYDHYGCWCGSGTGGGNDDPPVDGIDQCCYFHDYCYNRAKNTSICDNGSIYPDADNYRWACIGGDGDGWVICGASTTICPRFLCDCDMSFVVCLQTYGIPTTKPTCTTSSGTSWTQCANNQTDSEIH